jgi:L-rhamnose mutarotase
MKRIGFLLKVKQDMLEDYKKHHEAVWPEMLDALRRTGWHNYSLFLREDGLLFGYFEAEIDLQTSQAKMAQEAINLKWQEFMGPYFEALGGARPDQNMIELEEVFHTD